MKLIPILILAIACNGTNPAAPFEDRLKPGNPECRRLESEIVKPSNPTDRVLQLHNEELFARKCTKGAEDELEEPSINRPAS